MFNKNKIDPSNVVNNSNIPRHKHYSSKSIQRVTNALEKGARNECILKDSLINRLFLLTLGIDKCVHEEK